MALTPLKLRFREKSWRQAKMQNDAKPARTNDFPNPYRLPIVYGSALMPNGTPNLKTRGASIFAEADHLVSVTLQFWLHRIHPIAIGPAPFDNLVVFSMRTLALPLLRVIPAALRSQRRAVAFIGCDLHSSVGGVERTTSETRPFLPVTVPALLLCRLRQNVGKRLAL